MHDIIIRTGLKVLEGSHSTFEVVEWSQGALPLYFPLYYRYTGLIIVDGIYTNYIQYIEAATIFFESRKYHRIHKNNQNSNISFLGGQFVDKLLPYHATS